MISKDASRLLDINPKYTMDTLAERLSGDQAITRSLVYNLLNSAPGDQSRIFKSDVGSHWRSLLQEHINDINAAKMEGLLLDSIDKWIPRIRLQRKQSSVVADMRLPGYRVRIVYLTPNSPTPVLLGFDVPL